MILANKYDAYREDIITIDSKAQEKFFSVTHVLQTSRYLDLQWPFQLDCGLIDISLRTMTENSHLDNKETKTILIQLLADGIDNPTRNQLEGQFSRYVTEEYQAVMRCLGKSLRQNGGIFRPHPSILPIP